MLSCGTGLLFTTISSPLSQDVLDVQYLSQLTDNIRDHEAFVPVIQYKKGDTLCCIQINSVIIIIDMTCTKLFFAQTNVHDVISN